MLTLTITETRTQEGGKGGGRRKKEERRRKKKYDDDDEIEDIQTITQNDQREKRARKKDTRINKRVRKREHFQNPSLSLPWKQIHTSDLPGMIKGEVNEQRMNERIEGG